MRLLTTGPSIILSSRDAPPCLSPLPGTRRWPWCRPGSPASPHPTKYLAYTQQRATICARTSRRVRGGTWAPWPPGPGEDIQCKSKAQLSYPSGAWGSRGSPPEPKLISLALHRVPSVCTRCSPVDTGSLATPLGTLSSDRHGSRLMLAGSPSLAMPAGPTHPFPWAPFPYAYNPMLDASPHTLLPPSLAEPCFLHAMYVQPIRAM